MLILIWVTITTRLDVERERSLRDFERNSANLARLFESHAISALQEAESGLHQVEREYLKAGSRIDLQHYLRPRHGGYEPYRAFAILDERGRVAAASHPLLSMNLPDWAPFRALAASAATTAHVSAPETGKLLQTCTFNLSRRMAHANGSFAGIVTIALDCDYFARLYQAANLSPDATAFLVGTDGIVRARSDGTRHAGENPASLPLYSEVASNANGHYNVVDAHGDSRLVTVRRVGSYPLAVLIDTPRHAALEHYRRVRTEYLVWSVSLSALVVLFALLTARQWLREQAADEALRRTADLLREAQRISRVGSWELDLRRDTLRWSDEIFRIFEMDPDRFEASYSAFLARVHPEDRDAVDAAYRQSVHTHKPYSIDHRLLLPTGRIKYVHEQGTTEYDIDGKPLRSVGTVQDITDRKLAEHERARLAAIVQHANDAIISRSLDGIITSWNAAAERVFGYTAGEMIGSHFERIRSAFPVNRMKDNAHRLAAGEVIETYESLRHHKDGRLIPVLTNLSPVKDQNGHVTGISVIMRDLREEKEANEQLALAASVFEHAAEGIIVTDAANRIVSVNKAFTRITGYTAEEVIGRNPNLLSSGRQTPDFYSEMWRVLNAEGLWQGEVWDRRKNGEVYCEALSVAVIRSPDGTVRNYCAIFMDITRRKRAETELMKLNSELEARVTERTRELETSNQLLRDANEELNAFSYSVSHDLRAPLRRIDAYSALVLDAQEGDSDQKEEWIARIQANVRGMNGLINDLLRLSTITRRELVMEDVDLTRLAEEVLSMLREEQPGNREIALDIEPGMRVMGDRALIRILLENLLGNALKFTRNVAATRIRVGSLDAPDGRAWFVADNGPGFDMRRADDIFRPFRRLHSAEEYEGTGIGLSIVQRIAHKHGGRVWVHAEPGKGATFYFSLSTRNS